MIGRFYFFLSCLPFTLQNSTLYILSRHAHTFCNTNHVFFLCIITVCEVFCLAGPSTSFVVLISLAPRGGLLAVTGPLPRCPNCKLGHPNGRTTDLYQGDHPAVELAVKAVYHYWMRASPSNYPPNLHPRVQSKDGAIYKQDHEPFIGIGHKDYKMFNACDAKFVEIIWEFTPNGRALNKHSISAWC